MTSTFLHGRAEGCLATDPRSTKSRLGTRRSTRACGLLVCLAACGGGGDPESIVADTTREQATAVQRIATRDKFAYASYFEDSGGCETLNVEVFALASSIRSDGTTSKQSEVRAQLVATDFCTGVSVFLSGMAVPETMRFRNNLTHAAVTATVVLDDLMGTTKRLSIDLAWDGGDLMTDKTKYVTVTPTSRTVIKSTGSIRRSETILGALVLDGADLLAADRPVRSRFTTGFVTASGGSTIEITRTP